MFNAWERKAMHAEFWLQNLEERDGFEDLGVHGTVTLKWILKEYDHGMWTGFIWHRTGTSGG